MATEGSTAAVPSSGRSASGGAKADSYIGSVISLTSKSEIRYEGILYNINTEESSIGLQNVRSFGTEGRKKDGPQVPPSDKIYEYILFRGSDIKDLQVKSSPPVQSTPPINSDPAIIQSHYPPPPAAQRSSLPAAPGGSLADHGSNSSQMGLPLYQPGGNFNSWVPPHPNANASGMAVPMYWPGFYGSAGGIPQIPQQSLLVPPPGLSIPSAMQPMQFSGFGSSLPTALPSLPTSSTQDHHSLVAPNTTVSSTLTSNSLPPSTLHLSVPPLPTGLPPSESSNSIIQNKVPTPPIATSAPSSSLPQLSQVHALVSDHSDVPPVAIKTVAAPGQGAMTTQTIKHPPRNAALSAAPVSSVLDTPAPSLVNPGKLSQPRPSAPAPQTSQTAQKDVEVVQVSPKQQSEPLVSSETETQPPLLPLPPSIRTQKVNGTSRTVRTNYRGRGGRVYAASGPSTSFTEEFDFNAMNEKFNKDEVWGHLGKVSKPEYGNFHEEEALEEEYGELPKIEIKPVYNKDDFFDTLSGNTVENDFNNGRPRYSEQMKLDTETFGDFPRHRGGRGGRASYRGGGGGFRGSYSGRGYRGGRSHGNMNRGRGRGVPAWAS